MRLNKVSELIHNSSNHQNLDSAGVSVHFQEIIDLVWFEAWIEYSAFLIYSDIILFFFCNKQDDGNYRAVDGSDFIISRVAFRDNTSKYYINDRASNFTEVTKLLKGKGVDLDNNRFLILQVLCVFHMYKWIPQTLQVYFRGYCEIWFHHLHVHLCHIAYLFKPAWIYCATIMHNSNYIFCFL